MSIISLNDFIIVLLEIILLFDGLLLIIRIFGGGNSIAIISNLTLSKVNERVISNYW